MENRINKLRNTIIPEKATDYYLKKIRSSKTNADPRMLSQKKSKQVAIFILRYFKDTPGTIKTKVML